MKQSTAETQPRRAHTTATGAGQLALTRQISALQKSEYSSLHSRVLTHAAAATAQNVKHLLGFQV